VHFDQREKLCSFADAASETAKAHGRLKSVNNGDDDSKN